MFRPKPVPCFIKSHKREILNTLWRSSVPKITRFCAYVPHYTDDAQYDEPRVENVARGRSPSATFSTEDHHI